MKSKKGISLIVLAITIIVMIILASAVIINLNDTDIINKTNGTVNNVEIANEKDMVIQIRAIAYKNKQGRNVTAEELQNSFDNGIGVGIAEVMIDSEDIIVKFNKSERYYEIDNLGNIEGPKLLQIDEYAGDITKGGVYDGSLDKPFKISCIEDLVAFSIMTNAGNKSLGLAANQFDGQYVELTKTLDFKSRFSYSDCTTTVYGDINKNGIVEDIRTELTKTEEGCIGFNGAGIFKGELNGNGQEIRNIYMNNTADASLVKELASGTIKNMGMTGEIYAEDYAGAFVENVSGQSKIINCYNKANIVAQCGSSSYKRYRRNLWSCECGFGCLKLL